MQTPQAFNTIIYTGRMAFALVQDAWTFPVGYVPHRRPCRYHVCWGKRGCDWCGRVFPAQL